MEDEQHISNIPQQPNNILHGLRLVDILEYLVASYGWKRLGTKINIRCFNHQPSINSSLKFLRKTDWARRKVEDLYILTKQREQEE